MSEVKSLMPHIKLEVPFGENRVLLHTCCAPCSGAIIECLLDNGIRPTIFYCNPNIWPEEEYLIRKNECTRFAELMGLDIVDDDYDHESWLRGLEELYRAESSKCRTPQALNNSGSVSAERLSGCKINGGDGAACNGYGGIHAGDGCGAIEAGDGYGGIQAGDGCGGIHAGDGFGGIQAGDGCGGIQAGDKGRTEVWKILAAAPERGERCMICFKYRLLRTAQYAVKHGFRVMTTTLASSRWKSLPQINEAGNWAVSEVLAKCAGADAFAVNCVKDNVGNAVVNGMKCIEENVEDGVVDGAAGSLKRSRSGGVGQDCGAELVWWDQNWRKGGLQERRGQLIKEYDFYNQRWCGCEFSKTSMSDV